MTERYEIGTQLEEDVLGTVYLAEDVMLQRRVRLRRIAYGDSEEVKKRDDSWRKDFAKYAGMLGATQHPNMSTIYDVAIEDTGATVVTQFIDGESLVERLKKEPIGQVGVFRMADDMLDALHAAHELGVFHGALHTGSIIRVDRAAGGHRYLIVDLGLNQLASMVKAQKVTVADKVLRAPELHDEERELDAKADLFMIGQLCYTALVGGHPFSGKSMEECLKAYQKDGMPHLNNYVEGVDPEFADWIMSLVECDPEKRPKDTGEAMSQLHTIELSEPEPNVPGETHAVVEHNIASTDEPEPVPETVPVIDPVHAAAANSAAAAERAVAERQDANTMEAKASGGGKKVAIALLIMAVLIGVAAWFVMSS